MGKWDYAKCESLRSEHDAPDGFYHFDLLAFIDNQQAVPEEAVFSTVRHHAKTRKFISFHENPHQNGDESMENKGEPL